MLLHPLLPQVVKHAFEGSVTDLAWSTDGWTLYVASEDGTVAVARFEEKELGVKISHVRNTGGIVFRLDCLWWKESIRGCGAAVAYIQLISRMYIDALFRISVGTTHKASSRFFKCSFTAVQAEFDDLLKQIYGNPRGLVGASLYENPEQLRAAQRSAAAAAAAAAAAPGPSAAASGGGPADRLTALQSRMAPAGGSAHQVRCRVLVQSLGDV